MDLRNLAGSTPAAFNHQKNGDKMNTQDFEKMILAMSQIIELKKTLENKENQEHEDDDNEEEEDDEENTSDKKIVEELNCELAEIFKWAFGCKMQSMSRQKSIKMWNKNHPDLPLPRAFNCPHLAPETRVLAILLDVIPLFHKRVK